MVGHVHDRDDLRDLLLYHHLDALAQCHVGHRASLAPALEPDVDGIVLDLHQPDEPAVAAHGGVDLLVQNAPASRRQARIRCQNASSAAHATAPASTSL